MQGAQEARHTLRQVGQLAVQRVLDIFAGMLFVALVPRFMGPQVYGQFSLLHSISLWFSLMGGMGAVSMMIRFVPELRERKDEEGLRQLMGGMLALRAVSGTLGGAAYIAIAALWIGSPDYVALLAMAAGIAARTAGNLSFTFFLGLNQGSRWGAAETLRRAVVLPAVLAGFAAAGVRGACFGIFTVEVFVLSLGLWWARGYLFWSRLRIDRDFLRPYLRFSSGFFVSNLLLVLFRQGGGPLVHLISGEFAEAGFYTIAFSTYLAITQALWRLINGFGAMFSSLLARGDTVLLTDWVEKLLKVFACGGVVGVALAYTMGGPAIRSVLGDGFQPVIAQVRIMSLAGISFGPAAVSRILAVILNQPRISIVGAAAQLVAFAGLCVLLVPVDPVRGAAMAAVGATAVFAANGVLAIRQVLPFSLRPWTLIHVWGLACSPLLWAWDGHWGLRLVLFCVAFAAGVSGTGIVSRREFASLYPRQRSGDSGRP